MYTRILCALQKQNSGDLIHFMFSRKKPVTPRFIAYFVKPHHR